MEWTETRSPTATVPFCEHVADDGARSVMWWCSHCKAYTPGDSYCGKCGRER